MDVSSTPNRPPVQPETFDSPQFQEPGDTLDVSAPFVQNTQHAPYKSPGKQSILYIVCCLIRSHRAAYWIQPKKLHLAGQRCLSLFHRIKELWGILDRRFRSLCGSLFFIKKCSRSTDNLYISLSLLFLTTVFLVP